MHKITSRLVVALGLLALAALGATSASAAEVKIGVVSLPRLAEGSPQGKLMAQTLQDEFAGREREIVALGKELQEKDSVFKRDGAVMSESERRNMERELREGQRDLQRRQQEVMEDFNIRRNEELGKLQRSLMQEVREYAKSNNFDIIIGEGVLYASDALNVTDQVLAALEARFQKDSAGN